MTGTVFRGTSGTTAVQATTFTALTTKTTTGSGVKVIIVPAAASDITYYGFTSGVLTTNGVPCPNGEFFWIYPNEFPLADGKPDLTSLYFISSAASQAVGGVLL